MLMPKLIVDTPGGINMLEELTGLDFSGRILEDLERKLRLRKHYGKTLSNVQLAML